MVIRYFSFSGWKESKLALRFRLELFDIRVYGRKFYFILFTAGLALELSASSGCGGYQGTMHPATITSTVMATATAGAIQQEAALTVTVN